MKDKIYFYDEDNVQKEGILLMNIKYKNNDYIIYTDNHKNENARKSGDKNLRKNIFIQQFNFH